MPAAPSGRRRGWCFTVNYSRDERLLADELASWWSLASSAPASADSGVLPARAVWQLERGDAGNLHVQGWCAFSSAVRFGTVVDWLPAGAHVEPQRGSPAQARAYCAKPDSRVDAPVHDVPPGPHWFGCSADTRQGSRSDLAGAVAHLREAFGGGGRVLERDFAHDFPTVWARNSRLFERAQRLFYVRPAVEDLPERLIVFIHGPTGTGKTYSALQIAEKMYRRWDICVKSESSTWFDCYTGQKCVIIDDYYSDLPYRQALTLFDTRQYPADVQNKGGWYAWRPEIVFITSNTPPHLQYKNVPNVDAWLRRVAPGGLIYSKNHRSAPLTLTDLATYDPRPPLKPYIPCT